MARALLALLLVASPALAHQSPSGWVYGASCCSGMDCRPVEPDEVTTGPSGYLVAPTGEVVPYNSPKVKPSGDGAMHRCMVGGVTSAPTICIYVPGGV